jgi:hypothetical protein
MKRLLSVCFLFAFVATSKAQMPSELCLKWASHTAGPVSAEALEAKLPSNDTIMDGSSLEVLQMNPNGQPIGLVKYQISGQNWVPSQHMVMDFNSLGFLESLEIWDWMGGAWEPSARLSRRFDAKGQEISFKFEVFENAGWQVLEIWQAPAPAIAAATRP